MSPQVAFQIVAYDIRTFGDPVLTSVAEQVENIDGKIVRLSQAMLQAMYKAPGLGLAAPQIGVQKQITLFPYTTLFRSRKSVV